MRTFFSVPLTASVRATIDEEFAPVRRSDAAIRWIPAENLHITLRFLGDITETQCATLIETLSGFFTKISTFAVSLAGTGVFPPRGQPRVLWIGIQDGADTMTGIADGLEERLVALGFPAADKPFRAHLTIGRVKGPRGLRPVMRAMEQMPSTFGVPTVDHIDLQHSHLSSDGATYTVLHRFALGKTI